MVRELRQSTLEVDFINNVAVDHANVWNIPNTGRFETPMYPFKPEMKDRFLEEVVGSYWHDAGKDELETIIFYSDNTCFAQRRKKKYSFETGTDYYESYQFTGTDQDKIIELRNNIVMLLDVMTWFKEHENIIKVNKIEEELLFFDQTYGVKLQQRLQLLQATDWRVLEDVDDTYAGEKDEWKKYRSEVRKIAIKKPDDPSFTTPLEWFKEISTQKYPVDPKIYRTEYPNGQDENGDAVEYLKADDEKQWVEVSTDSSTDIWKQRLMAVNELRAKYKNSTTVVQKEMRDMMKTLRVEDFVDGGIDYTKIYTQEEIDALGS